MRKAKVMLAAALLQFAFVTHASALTVNVYDGHGYWDGTPFSNLVGSFESPDIMFATNTGYAWHPFGLGDFGAQILGSLYVAADDSYTFFLNSDDGSSLFVDGGLVVGNGNPHGPTVVGNTAFLTSGFHSFAVNFYEDFGGPSGVDLYLPSGVRYASASVPEPSMLLLLGAGIAGLPVLRRRLKRS